MLKMGWVMIGTDEPKTLVDFYKKVLGEPTWADDAYTGWGTADSGFMIGYHSEVKGHNEMPGRFIVNFETPDVQGEFARIKELGAVVVREPYKPGGDADQMEMWLATFEDPDGNYIQLASPMPAPQ
jgi:predicted enzyme related to lactoylglutathione lyase